MVLLFSLPIIEMSQKALKIRENYHINEIFFVSLHRETIKQGTMTDELAQEIYNDGYAQGKKDAEARFEIGTAYANNHQMRDLEAINKMVQENPKHSDEYKQAYAEIIERYLGMIEFQRDGNKYRAKEVVEEQMRVARNRLEERYRKAVEERRIDHTAYTQIIACIEATYQELFMAGVRVGMGELVGPQRIHINNKEE